MMRLQCNGFVLDLYENTGFQLKDENPLFAFDKIACERTTNFKLPATPTNDKVLELARIPAYNGDGMRRKFAAQLQSGTVVKDGYLYVSSFDGKDYNVVFVTGELLGLQRIKDLGKISDIITTNAYATYSAYGGIRPSQAETSIYAAVNYMRQTSESFIRPSIQLKLLYNLIRTQLELELPDIPDAVGGIRIIPAETNGLKKTDVTLTESPRNMTTSGYPVCLYVSTNLQGNIITWSTARVARYINNMTTKYTGTVRQYEARQPLKITFPEDWNDDLFIGRFVTGYQTSEEHTLEIFEFLGGRSFDRNKNVTGDSLRGRTVEIARGGKFLIIDKSDYIYQQGSGGLNEGWYIQGGNFVVKMEGGELDVGSIVRLQDNLPDYTVTELLKYIAALSGTVLNYNEKDGLTFDNLIFDAWAIKDLNYITKRGEVKRTFGDYAQRNTVTFDNGEGISYTIENETLEDENNLLSLPFVQGGGTAEAIYIQDDIEESVIGTNKGGEYLARVELPKNEGLQRVCNESTQIKIESRMPLLKYNDIKAKTGLIVDNSIYIFTDKQWQKDIAKLTLARITLNRYGLNEETIRILVSQYGENVLLDILNYIKQYPAIVPYINDSPDIAVYTCNIIQPDANYPYPVSGRAEIVFPNIVSTSLTSVRFGYKLMQATGEIIPLYFGIYGMQNFCYAVYNYNSNPNRIFIYHGTGTSGTIAAVIMQGVAIGDYIEQYFTHSALIVTAGGATEQTTYSGTWRGNPLGLMYTPESANNARIYYVQVYEGNSEEHRLYRLPDGRFWNSIKGRFETVS